MRFDEILRLSWDAVDFKAKTITVDKQLTYLDSKGYFFSTPKTVSSVRIIAADDFLIEQLCRWRLQQVQNELVFGDSYVYCIRNDGRAILPHNIVNFFQNAGETCRDCQ